MIYYEDDRINAYLELESSNISMDHIESFHGFQDIFEWMNENEDILWSSWLEYLGFLYSKYIFAWIFGFRWW